MSQADHDFEIRYELLPKRKGQAVAGILPTPVLVRVELLDRMPGADLQRSESRPSFRISGQRDGAVPAAAELVEDLVVHVDEGRVLPVPLGILRGRGDEIRLLAEIHAHDAQELRGHRRARPVHPADRDRHHARLVPTREADRASCAAGKQLEHAAFVATGELGRVALEMRAQWREVFEPPRRRTREQQVPGPSIVQRFELPHRVVAVGGMMAGVLTIGTLREMLRRRPVELEQVAVPVCHDEHVGPREVVLPCEPPDALLQVVVVG